MTAVRRLSFRQWSLIVDTDAALLATFRKMRRAQRVLSRALELPGILVPPSVYEAAKARGLEEGLQVIKPLPPWPDPS